jgi:hypothetical protein
LPNNLPLCRWFQPGIVFPCRMVIEADLVAPAVVKLLGAGRGVLRRCRTAARAGRSGLIKFPAPSHALISASFAGYERAAFKPRRDAVGLGDLSCPTSNYLNRMT